MTAPDLSLAKTPPNAPEAEKSVLTALFTRPGQIGEVAQELTPADFYTPGHRVIYSAFLSLHSEGRAADLVTVADTLERKGHLDTAGGGVYLAELAGGIAGDVAEHVGIVRDAALRRKMIEAGNILIDHAYNRGSDLSGAVKVAEEITQAAGGLGRGKDSSRAFRFLPLGELLSAPTPTKWLVRDYLEAETLSVLFGEPGTMKTFVALDWGLCVASGHDWHGNRVANPGAVFYLAGEGFQGLRKRIQAWTVAYGIAPESLPFFVSNSPAQFLDGASAAAVAESVAALSEQGGPPRLVIVDTLNRNMGAGDENSSQDMTAFVSALDKLRTRFGCAVLVVHHSGLNTSQRARGSSVLRGAVDFEYRMEKRGASRVLSCTKCKDHEGSKPVAFVPDPVGTGWTDYDTLEEITSCVLRAAEMPEGAEPDLPTGAARIALDALVEACKRAGGPAHVNEWRRIAYERGISSGAAPAKKMAFRRAKQDLERSGVVRGNGDLWSVTQGEQREQQGNMLPMYPGAEGEQGEHTPLGVFPLLPCPYPGTAEEIEDPFKAACHA